MRALLTVLTIAALAATAHAQEMGGRGGKRRGSPQSAEQQKAAQQKKKAVDDAHKSALGRISESKEKYDPWRRVRSGGPYGILGVDDSPLLGRSRMRRV